MLFRKLLERSLTRFQINSRVPFVEKLLPHLIFASIRHVKRPVILCQAWSFNYKNDLNKRNGLTLHYNRRNKSSVGDGNGNVVPELKETECETKSQGDSILKNSTQGSGKAHGYKDLYIVVSSGRAVTIANKAFSLGTKRMNELFFNGCIRLNSKRIPKKTVQATVGDVIDVILETSDTEVILQRVEILMEDETSKGNEQFYIRRWKRLKLPLLLKTDTS